MSEKISRRNFLRTATLGAAAAGLLAGCGTTVVVAVPPPPPPRHNAQGKLKRPLMNQCTYQNWDALYSVRYDTTYGPPAAFISEMVMVLPFTASTTPT